MSKHGEELVTELKRTENRWIEVTTQEYPHEAWRNKIRSIPGRRYIPEERKWRIPATLAAVTSFYQLFRDDPVRVDEELSVRFPVLLKLMPYGVGWREPFRQALKRKGFSLNTQKAYLGHVERLLQFAGKQMDQISPDDLRRYPFAIGSKSLFFLCESSN